MKKDSEYSRAIAKNMVDGFMRFKSDVLKDSIRKEIPLGIVSEAFVEAMYESLFSSILTFWNTNGASVPPHKEAIADRRVHEKVAHHICGMIHDRLSRMDRRYVWSVGIAKRERGLKE